MVFSASINVPTSPSLSVDSCESIRAAVDRLVERALAHRAVRHPFLSTLASGGFGARTGEVAVELARWYHGYSSRFPTYLSAVIDSLERPDHSELLGHNLAEEKGHLDPAERGTIEALGICVDDVDGVSHPRLFEKYCDAVGVTAEVRCTPPEQTQRWRTAFLNMLSTGSAAFGVGALGIATESIVAATYEQVLKGLRLVDGLERRDVVFFELHCHVDDQHQADLLEIARDLAQEPGGMEDLERGMMASLELRAQFWDALHAACLSRPLLVSTYPEIQSA